MFRRGRALLTAVSVVLSSFIVAPLIGVSVAHASSQVTGVTGTAGNGQVSLTWTGPSASTFPFTFNGVSYNSVFIGSNTYITFGGGSANYSGLSASNPNLPGVHMCAADNSFQRVQFLLNTSVTPNQLRVRYEGNAGTSGTVGSPGIVYEAVFYRDQNYFDLLIGSHNACPGGTRLITNGSTQLAAPAFAANTNWRITGGSFTQNGHSASWLGTTSGTVAPNTLGFTSIREGSVDDGWTEAPTAPTGYAIRHSSDNGATWTTHTTNTGTSATSRAVTGLTNGVSYIFQVAAYYSSTNTTGPWSASSPAYVPLGTAAAPTNATRTARNGAVDLSWTAPSNNGGSAITDYRVQFSSNGGATWTDFNDGVSTATSASVTGLTNGVSYTFRVAAINSSGTGADLSFAAITPFTVPGAPTSVSPTAGSGQATVSWTAPASNGGSAITGYAVDFSSDGGTTWTTSIANTGTTTTSHTVTGLTANVNYVFRVAARNAAGVGAWSSNSTQATVFGLPGTPAAPTVSAGNGQVALSWTAPSNNGSAINGYAIQFSTNSGSTWSNWSTNTGTSATTNTVTSLANGTSYVFRVAARNAAGQGSFSSASVATVPFTVPGTPASVSATVGSTQATVTWSAPASNGSPITDYTVQFSSNNGTSWSTFADGVSATTSATVTGLTNGVAYVFRVSATNAGGSSAFSTASAAVTPRSTPGAPTNVAGTAGNTQVTIAWSAPASNGGSALTGYAVQQSSNSGTTWTTVTTNTATTATSYTVTGLTNGVEYVFRVAALNAVGTGSYSGSSPAITPFTTPGAPTSLVGTPQNLQVTLVWSAPGSNGGNPISDYVVQYSSNSGSTWITFADGVSTSTTATVTGLLNGTGYIFQVIARNAAGDGPASVSTSSVIPRTVPSAVPTVSVMVGNTQVVLTWGLPVSTGGSAITDYLVELSSDSGTTWSTFIDGVSTTRSATVTGLTNGTSYTFRVSAINAAGTGPGSQVTSSVVPFTTPAQPTSVVGTSGDAQVSLSWSAPTGNGGSPITDYNIQYSSNSGSTWTTVSRTASTALTATVTGLTNGTGYIFRVAAVNSAGAGSYSAASSTVTPMRVANAPTVSSLTPFDAQIVVSWSAPSSNGGSAITGYAIQHSTDSGVTWSSATLTGSSSTTFAMTGLTNGVAYVFRVAAVNAVGTGAYSASSTPSTPRTMPNAPTGITVTTGNTQVSLVWQVPTSNGGSAITDYVVQFSSNNGVSWVTFADGTSAQRAATVTGLLNGTEYLFRVAAVNVAGQGPFSAPSEGSTPRTVPSAPTITSITTGNAQLSVNFTAGDTGGTVISTYEYSTDGGVSWRPRALGTTASPLVISTQSVDGTSSLSNGTTYSVRLRAVNVAGPGSASATMNATPLTLPTVPLSVSATPGATSASVSWSSPSSDGGAAVTDYLVQVSADSGSTWTTFSDGVSSSTTASVTALTNGVAYIFRVAAVNSVGTGSYSLASASVTPRSTPGAPSGLTVVPGNGTLAVTWTAPANGGAVVTDYTIQFSSNSGSSWTTFTDGLSVSTSEVIAGLTNGTAYLVRVAAVNAAGTGSWGTTQSSTTPRTVPSAPVLGIVSRLDSSLSIAYTAGSDGGSVITGYQSSIDGGATWQAVSGLTSPLVLSGLTNGTTYNVSLRAVNVAGAGSAAVSVQGTPRTAPSAPVISSITPGNSSLSVAFVVANNGGSVLQNIEYSVTGGVTWLSAGSTSSPVSIGGLANGTTYQVRLRAVNAAGTSPQSALSASTPFTTPGAPTITSVSGGIGAVTVGFTAGYDGGSAISNYAYSTDNGATWTTRSPASTTSPFTITGLSDGVRYSVRLRAVNAAGNGSESDAVSVQTKGVPGAPTITSVAQLNGRVALTIASGTNGGDPISNYAYSTDNGATWTTRSPAGTDPSLLITGLTNGTDYGVRVRAINSVGHGEASASVTARPRTTPGAPTINSQTPGNQELTISFTAGPNGGEQITSYEYSTDRGLTWNARSDGGGTSTTLVITTESIDGMTALTNGTTYDVQIRAVNIAGAGEESADITATPRTTPAAPVVSEVAELNQRLRVAFLPQSNGGARITSYQYTTDGGTTWRTADTLSSPIGFSTSSVDGTTALVNGTSYSVGIRAVNSEGPGAASAFTTVVPRTSPGSPSVTTVTPGDGTISVAFNEGGNGGSSITSYEYSTDGGATWRTRAIGNTMFSSPITISRLSSDGLTALSNGASYDVLIRAVNAAGHGEESATFSAIPSGVPNAPVISSVVGGDGSLIVNYTPGSANGRAITVTEYSTDGGGTWIQSTSLLSPLTITGLTNGTQYLVTLRHTNVNGTSGDALIVVGKPRSRPLAPTLTAFTASDGSVSVNFSAPPSDGGDSITNYEYSTDNGATWRTRAFGTVETFMGISTLSSDGATPLTNGTVYNVRIRAVNAAGGGVPSDVLAVKPFTRPGNPVITSIAPGDSVADVVYSLASNGGSPVTNIEFTLDGGATWVAANSTANPVRVHGLQNGATQSIAIRVTNAAGTGPASNAMNVMPTGTPGAPTITSLVAGNGQLRIEFAAANDSGSPITNYQYSVDDGVTWVTPSAPVTTSPLLVTGLVNGQVYRTRIRAVNDNGVGAMSDAVLSRPFTVPSAPTAQARPGTNEIRVSFTPPASDGGESIIGYEYSLDGGVTWVSVPSGTNGEFVITNLVNVANYSVTFRAVSAAGSGAVATAQSIVEVAPAPPPAPPAPVVVPVVSPSPAPPSTQPATPIPAQPATPTPSPVRAPRPIVQRPVSSVPRVAPGGLIAQQNGRPVAATVKPVEGSAVEVRVGNTAMTLAGLTSNLKRLRLNSAGHVMFKKDGIVAAEVKGFAENSEVQVFIYSTPVLLGTYTVDATGSAEIKTKLPEDLEVGGHTLEVRGTLDDGSVKAMFLGVEVVEDAEVVDEEPTTPNPVDVPELDPTTNEQSSWPVLPVGAAALMLLLAAVWLSLTVLRRRSLSRR